MKYRYGYWWILLILISCRSGQQAIIHSFEDPFDTSDKPVLTQEKRTEEVNGIFFDNQFDGARMNELTRINDSIIRIEIRPENMPINPSPWFAFRIWSTERKKVYVELDYGKYKHRYHPKISSDGNTWNESNYKQIEYIGDSTKVRFPLLIAQDTLWVAAQEIISSSNVLAWSKELAAESDQVFFKEMGKSRGGRVIPVLEVYDKNPLKKPVLILLSRQHPPEVTGFMAMQSFIKTILGEEDLATEFRKQYRIMIFPVLNPDGVDEGHWRHNLGGVDLNRDWAEYRQLEIRQVANYIVRETSKYKNQVVLGLDFHSTYHDVYYTNENVSSVIPGFKDKWLENLEKNIENFKVNERPSEIKRPVSKSWFYAQFKAEGITYEIGDDTPRDFIETKGRVSAEEMMKLLIKTP